MKKVIALTTLLFGLTGCAGVDMNKQGEEWARLTKEHFAQTTVLKDDDLETEASLNTINGHQFTIDTFGSVGDDDFFRAFINKKTGKVTYQLYRVIRYDDNGWHHYNAFNYQSPTGAESSPAILITKQVDCSRYAYTKQCSYEEHVALDLDDEFMRWVASQYNPSKSFALPYKVSSKSGNEKKHKILCAEAAGLIERVDAYLAAHGLPKK